MVAEILTWDKKTRKIVEEISWDNRLDELHGSPQQEVIRAADDQQEAPWDAWDNYVDKMNDEQTERRAACAAA